MCTYTLDVSVSLGVLRETPMQRPLGQTPHTHHPIVSCAVGLDTCHRCISMIVSHSHCQPTVSRNKCLQVQTSKGVCALWAISAPGRELCLHFYPHSLVNCGLAELNSWPAAMLKHLLLRRHPFEQNASHVASL